MIGRLAALDFLLDFGFCFFMVKTGDPFGNWDR
jgi:hypothetical protein